MVDGGYGSAVAAHTQPTDQVHHPPEHFLLWSASDFQRNPEAHMKQMVRWLGMDAEEINTHMELKRDIGAAAYLVRELPVGLQAQLQAVFAAHNERLFQLLTARGFAAFAQHLKTQWARAAALSVAR